MYCERKFMKLTNGSRVCIVGGGPAGCFAAMNLIRYAEECNLKLEVLIFESRDSSRGGPAGCKGCAGILSSTLIKNLASIGITIPRQLVLDDIKSYVLHIPNIGCDTIVIDQPDPERNIYSISRGSGPVVSPLGPALSFDGYLREQACRRGAKLIKTMVRSVEWEDGPVVIAGDGHYHADLLVIATGINCRDMLSPFYKYDPPGTVTMVQNEFIKPADIADDTVAAFFGEPDDIFFGTLVPKGKYINISLFGKNRKMIRKKAVEDFLNSESARMKQYFPVMPETLCSCMPRMLVKASGNYFGDRWVAVGDAVVSRLYKDGIGTAFLTADEAMKSAIEYGISGEDFRKDYMKLCRSIKRDNYIGSLMFRVFSYMLEKPVIAVSINKCVHEEKNLSHKKRIFTILIWGMLTGDYSYGYLLGRMFNPGGIIRFVKSLFFN
jgi:flavin-dependent dehydrogenase